MIKVSDVYNFIDSFAPYSTQAEFDNSGYMIGDKSAKVKRILVSLDLTADVLRQAKENSADLIVTHHPVIFQPLHSVMSGTVVYNTVQSGISVISAHTNLDIAENGVNTALVNALGIKEYSVSEADPFIKIAQTEPLDSTQLVRKVSSGLDCAVQFNNVRRKVSRIGFCSGAGSFCLYQAIEEGVDAFITGEAKYNCFSDAEEKNVLLICAGHFDTENIIVPVLAKMLREHFKDIEVIESKEKNPVNTYTNK